MKLNFWKMHGARNDFVLFDNRGGDFPAGDRAFIAHVAARRSGIGSEGVILIEPSESCDFYMHFFNPDGGEAEMCGNGARCAARLAFELDAADKQMSIETAAGAIRAEVLSQSVRLWMTEPTDWRLDGLLELDERTMTYGFVNTGVPHVVMRTGDVQDVDVEGIGSTVRRHRDFAPEGTNVNFMQVCPEGDIRVRTFERGVEAETAACGTGVTACALVAARNGWARLPILVHTRSGALLTVDGRLTENGVCDVTLTGPTAHVFKGEVDYRTAEHGFQHCPGCYEPVG